MKQAFVFGIASLVAACAAQPRRPMYGTASTSIGTRAIDGDADELVSRMAPPRRVAMPRPVVSAPSPTIGASSDVVQAAAMTMIVTPRVREPRRHRRKPKRAQAAMRATLLAPATTEPSPVETQRPLYGDDDDAMAGNVKTKR